MGEPAPPRPPVAAETRRRRRAFDDARIEVLGRDL